MWSTRVGYCAVFCLTSILLLSTQARSQQPAPVAPAVVTAVTDLSGCKSGNATSCNTYGASLLAACTTTGTAIQQLGCKRQAQCYQDRGRALAGSGKNAPSTDSCDAMLRIGTGDNLRGGISNTPVVYIPVITFSFPDMWAGDCSEQKGTLIVRSGGEIDWDAVVSTSRTIFGDVWHAKFIFKDKNGVQLNNLTTYDSPKMGSPGMNVHWTFTDHIDPKIVDKIVTTDQVPSC